MSDEQAPNAKGPAPVQGPVGTGPNLIPASEVKPEDIGALSLHYADGVPVLVVSGGTVVPAGITIVDNEGAVVGAYIAGPVPAPKPEARASSTDLTVTGLITPSFEPLPYPGVTFSDSGFLSFGLVSTDDLRQ